MQSFYPKANTNCIYTTGAFLTPLMVKDDDGNPEWLWVVSSFNDDTFLDGKTCAPVERAETIENLFKSYDDEEDDDDDDEEDDECNIL
jgi:hypothetical protein